MHERLQHNYEANAACYPDTRFFSSSRPYLPYHLCERLTSPKHPHYLRPLPAHMRAHFRYVMYRRGRKRCSSSVAVSPWT